MGKLITVVGNSGVGKTTLTRRLLAAGPFTSGLEQHDERPFQRLFAEGDPRYALPNQVDYLLFRAEQELEIRRSRQDGIQDGGLDEDFYLFTRLFYQKGDLSQAEFELCRRMHNLLRQLLGPPDLVVWLKAPLEVLADRIRGRGRPVEAARVEDLVRLQNLLEDWLKEKEDTPVLEIDASQHDPEFEGSISDILERIHDRLWE